MIRDDGTEIMIMPMRMRRIYESFLHAKETPMTENQKTRGRSTPASS